MIMGMIVITTNKDNFRALYDFAQANTGDDTVQAKHTGGETYEIRFIPSSCRKILRYGGKYIDDVYIIGKKVKGKLYADYSDRTVSSNIEIGLAAFRDIIKENTRMEYEEGKEPIIVPQNEDYILDLFSQALCALQLKISENLKKGDSLQVLKIELRNFF